MSTTITEGWLKDEKGVKFAPKTLISQVITSDGVTLDEKLEEDLKKLDDKADASALNNYVKTADLSTALDTRDTSIKNYVDGQFTSKVGADTVAAQLTAHNTADNAHDDIRELIGDLSDRLDDFSGLDEETIGQLAELLTLLEQEGDSLDQILAGKVNTSDIVNNLTTNDDKKVLSAAQGVAIKTAMDTMQEVIDDKADADDLGDYVLTSDLTSGRVTAAQATKADSLNVTSVIGASNKPVYFKSDGTPAAISYTIGKSVPSDAKFTDTYPPNANGTTTLGLVKGGGNVTISDGVITVNDNSHSHTIANVTGLDTALNSKQATITGAATTITSNDLTANRALISNASGKVAVFSAITSTELGYLDGVSSNIQDQFDAITGSNFTAAKATADGNGNDIAKTYALKSSITSIIDGNTTVGEANSATTATTATKATNDGNGKNIVSTYATKTELSNGLADKVPTSRKINNKPLSTDITITASELGVYTKAEIDTAVDNISLDITNIKNGKTTVGAAQSAAVASAASKLGSYTIGSKSTPIYLNAGEPEACYQYAGGTEVTLNGFNKGYEAISIYAPTSSGSYGQVLVSRGAYQEPVWSTISTSAGSNLPSVNATNEGQFLRVVNGKWAAVTINTAESGAF